MPNKFFNKINPLHQEKFNQFYKKLQAFEISEDSHVLLEKVDVKKPILFLAATHGDESIGIEVLKDLGKSADFDWLIANEKALELNQRFVDCDLNRAGPGNSRSEKHEERRAAEIIKQAKNYNSIIDLHGSKVDTGLFIILTKLSFNDLMLALQFNIKNIVIWLPSTTRDFGPLVEFIEPAIEIEAGPKNDPGVARELKKIIKEFCGNYSRPITKENLAGKNIYFVNGKLEKCDRQLKDFELTKIDDEEFYPLLAGEYEIACYKMIKVHWTPNT